MPSDKQYTEQLLVAINITSISRNRLRRRCAMEPPHTGRMSRDRRQLIGSSMQFTIQSSDTTKRKAMKKLTYTNQNTANVMYYKQIVYRGTQLTNFQPVNRIRPVNPRTVTGGVKLPPVHFGRCNSGTVKDKKMRFGDFIPRSLIYEMT
jgi:hypothetical protein